MIKKYFPLIFLFIVTAAISQTQVKILFDATKAEMAGNADWVIDANSYNLNPYTNPETLGGTESNPQQTPFPAQSGINASTPETYWDGAISHWAIDCVRQGYTVESLPYNGRITYLDSTNGQDLSLYRVFVVDEPNSVFTLAEKNAIVNFVKNGGGLIMIADHYISDRNSDGWESLTVWNDLMTTNTVQANPFGITFNQVNISPSSSNFANLTTSNPSANQILKGSTTTCSKCGIVGNVVWFNGTTMNLSPPTVNTHATGLIFTTAASITAGISNVMCASSTYYNGRLVAIGDSSIADDGTTGDPNDTSIYDGYTTDAGLNHQKLLMNAIVWLVENPLKTNDFEASQPSITIAPNPIGNKELKVFIKNTSSLVSEFTIYDATGRQVKQVQLTENLYAEFQTINCEELQAGLYFGRLQTASFSKSIPFSISN